jgi:glutamine amidotransferase
VSGPDVRLLDYGAGNLRSVRRALEAAGARVDVGAGVGGDALVIPGVGAFAEARRRLAPVWDDLAAWAREDRPLLGICLGFQLLFEESEEHGRHGGLGVLPGRVEALPATVTVPHMGWQRLDVAPGAPAAFAPAPCVYFCHSYGVRSAQDPARDAPWVVARVEHGHAYVAAVQRGHTWGVQFHPEKSGEDGLRVLRAWVDAVAARSARAAGGAVPQQVDVGDDQRKGAPPS